MGIREFDADSDHDSLTLDLKWCGQFLLDSVCNADCFTWLKNVFEEHGEFIAA